MTRKRNEMSLRHESALIAYGPNDMTMLTPFALSFLAEEHAKDTSRGTLSGSSTPNIFTSASSLRQLLAASRSISLVVTLQHHWKSNMHDNPGLLKRKAGSSVEITQSRKRAAIRSMTDSSSPCTIRTLTLRSGTCIIPLWYRLRSRTTL